MKTKTQCPKCKGTGYLRTALCPHCQGLGKVDYEHQATRNIASFVADYIIEEADGSNCFTIPFTFIRDNVKDVADIKVCLSEGEIAIYYMDYYYKNLSEAVTNLLTPVMWQLVRAMENRIEWEERERKDRIETESWLNGVGRFV